MYNETKMLVFRNQDATPQDCILVLHIETDITPILSWYGAFYDGDNYKVFLDGNKIPLDLNGDRKGPVLTLVGKGKPNDQ